ncbi:kelch-like protein 3 [Bolinopsis microptera]|uniref:kelch-like protein 3 n=1 Tax=Bolinopsis microptera TaxID=2820187 RepID=UPI003079546F
MTQPTSKVALEVNLDDDNDSMGQQTNIEPLQSLSLAGSNEMGEMASFVYKEPNSSQSLLDTLSDFKEKDLLCDVVVVTGTTKFSCHKVILAARSRYFNSMFLSGMTECNQEEIEIKGVSPEIMSILIDYTYTGQVTIDVYNVQELVLAADRLSFISMRTACFNFMLNHMDVNNCMGLLHIAERLDCKETIASSLNYISQYFEDIYPSEEFLEIPLMKIKAILSSDELNVQSELVAFEGMLKWVKHDLENRSEFLAELLNLIRLNLLTVEHLIEKIECEPLVMANAECNRILHNVKNHHLMPHKRQFVKLHGVPTNSERVPRKRIRPHALFVCGGIDSKRIFLKSVECYDVEREEWFPCADMLTKRGSHGIALMNGKIYAVGGHDGNEFLDTVEMYDPITDVWTSIPNMTRARNGAGAAVIGDNLYAIGGRDKQSRHKTCERFSHERGSWQQISDMNHGRAGAAVAALNNKIYAVGGRSNDKTYLRSMEYYDPETNQWNIQKPMESCRYFFSMAVVNEIMYVIGGNIYHENDDVEHRPVPVELFDPQKEAWEMLDIKSDGITLRSVCVLDNKVILAGGIKNGAMLKTVHCFNTSSDKFTDLPCMKTDRGGCGMIAFTPTDMINTTDSPTSASTSHTTL